MADVTLVPILLSDVELSLGTNDYEGSVSSVEFVPSSNVVTWKGMKPGSNYSFPTDPTWAANVGFAQDWETPNSLSRYLFEHKGETVPATFAPKAGGGHWEADLILVPGNIGGAGDAVAVSQVSLGVQGEPEWVPAAG